MSGIIELVLTYKARNKGWGGRALLPWLGAFALMLLIALSIGVGGGSAKAMPAVGSSTAQHPPHSVMKAPRARLPFL